MFVISAFRQDLHAFPGTAAGAVRAISATVERRGAALSLVFTATGDLSRVRLPSPAPHTRADGLWHHSCFEMFVRAPRADAYQEFNFSPSGQWAAYAFQTYRSRRNELDCAAPSIAGVAGPDALQLLVSVQLPPHAWDIGLAAVVEEVDGHLSYWALVHPSDKPDFHHPGGFALKLPGPAN